MKSPLRRISFNVVLRLFASGREISDEALLRSVDQCRSLSALQKLHFEVASRRPLASDPAAAIKLMRAYALCGDPVGARRLFDESSERNVVFFNVMIRSYVANGRSHDALFLFSDMVRLYGVRPDNYTYPCALKACSSSENLAGGIQIHGSVTKLGLDSNLFVGNALITMYARSGNCLDARSVFDEMPHRDIVSWNAIIAGYSQSGLAEKAMELFREIRQSRRPRFDAGTMASILPAMSNAKQADIELTRAVFDEIRGRNLISWNAMIAVYANNSLPSEALNLFIKMEKEEIEPDVVTLASVLPACGDLSALSLGKKLHEHINKKQMLPNLILENALMDMYANCGCLPEAKEVFSNMKGRDVVSWTAIISAYGMHGRGREAISLFEQMKDSGIKPDHIAFVSVLSACSYSGLLDDGNHYFDMMKERYQLVPRLEHYACMVDLLGRSGQVEKAYDFVKKMPVEPNERIWGALLGACRVHSNMSVGLISADHLFRLVPKQSGYYVLLSNIYARAGRWKDVSVVRSLMASKGIKKSPGCSIVEIGGKVYNFYIGDRSHPRTKEIYAELEALLGKMKEAGYRAETDAALHDVEEEDKEGHLLAHSEKLAIAFALISSGEKTQIRITMNLRMCGDCHRAAKLISEIRGREIVIKDCNRFHRFEGGVCSCGDYW
ncbi:Putative pentatricopeptide repeat-containing protein [Apostasia shenzhenica]|uniref:Pentatricopeptide repeat-containing protein n=1 Tax=Apostasia shenzhenica TaxID=1088818 RepID=A0A2I0AEK7_9ASPA|nr:Putative pentatricopeptide repeat-containing protein [Apostasia shenzhenica]